MGDGLGFTGSLGLANASARSARKKKRTFTLTRMIAREHKEGKPASSDVLPRPIYKSNAMT